jgi:hypothetical protein
VATTSEFSLPANIAFANPSPSAPAEFLPPAEVSIGRDVPSIATLNGGITLTSASMERSQPTSPRYVLDRIAITPASYDVPKADF